MFELVVERHFAAAHSLPGYPGPCARVHGHNYRVRVYVRGTVLDENGMLADFGIIKADLDALLARFDHYNLNDLPEFASIPPSTERLAQVVAEGLQPTYGNGILHRIEVRETPTQAATYFVTSRGDV